MHQSGLNTVLTNTFTVVEAERRLALLKEFLEHVFYQGASGLSKETLQAFAQGTIYSKEDIEAVASWSGVWGSITSGTLYKRLNELLAEIQSIPVLTLYTAVKFDAAHLGTLTHNIRKLTATELFVDDHVEPHLYAGCAFVWNGVYHDYSLSFFMRRKEEELLTLVSRYGSN